MVKRIAPPSKQKIKGAVKPSKKRAIQSSTTLTKREVRHAATELKSLGLLYRHRDLRRGPVTSYMRRKVAQLSPVLRGEAKAITGLSRETIEKATGQKGLISHGRNWIVIEGRRETIDYFEDEVLVKVRPLPKGRAIEELSIPGGDDVDAVMRWLVGKTDADLKAGSEHLAFRLGDGMSSNTFTSIRQLQAQLNAYRSHGDDEFDSLRLILFRVYPPGVWYDMARGESEVRRDFWSGFHKKSRGLMRRRGLERMRDASGRVHAIAESKRNAGVGSSSTYRDMIERRREEFRKEYKRKFRAANLESERNRVRKAVRKHRAKRKK